MEITYHKIVIPEVADPAGSSKNFPADVITRLPGDVWRVAASPLLGETRWLEFRKQDRTVITLFPYLCQDDPVDVFGFAFQLGVLAAASQEVRKLHLSLGSHLEEVTTPEGGTAWRVWLGVGLVLKRGF